MELKIIDNISLFYENRIPKKYLVKIEDFLFSVGFFTIIPQFLAKFTFFFS